MNSSVHGWCSRGILLPHLLNPGCEKVKKSAGSNCVHRHACERRREGEKGGMKFCVDKWLGGSI